MPGEETKAAEGTSPNPGKKLVQTRLPFKILSPGVGNKAEGTPKRKLSSPALDDRAIKVLKTNEENDSEQMDDTSEFSNPDAIIVIHDEDSLEKDARNNDITSSKDDTEKSPKAGEEKEDENDDKGIRIKFPFIKKAKGEAKQEEPKKSKEKDAVKGKRKRSRKEEKVEDSGAKNVEVDDKEKLPEEASKVECKEESTSNGDSTESPVKTLDYQSPEKPQEEIVEEPAAEVVEVSTDDDKDSGKDDSEEDLEEQKSQDEINMICEEKLSRSSDGDNQSSAVETPPRKKAKECSTPLNSKDPEKKLTPRQLEKKQEMEKRREERLAEKLNRKKKLEEEKEQKRKEKEEKEEQKRKEREEKEEQKRKERDEKERKRLAEIEAKNEEKRLKEEERRQKEEEKRQKEEEKRQKEEEKKKKEDEKKEAAKRASDHFKKFFMLKSKPSSGVSSIDSDKENSSDDMKSSEPRFMPFCVKPDMRLAPNTRRNLKEDQKSYLDRVLNETPVQQEEELYLKNLRERNPMKSGSTWPQEDDSDNEIVLIDNEGQKIEEIKPTIKYRVKFLSFHENQRPPYYGTWRKKSSKLGPRNPFGKDEKLFDYEVDSDDEWEEEEPGESLHGSDDEKDKESEDDYEVDNDFFVPHGHLSDEELQNEDEVDEDNSPEMQKAKLKLLQQEFADEMKKKTEKLKPRLIGCIWQSESGEKPDSCSEVIWRLLSVSKMLFSGPIVIKESESAAGSPSRDEVAPESAKKRKKLHEEDVKNFIRLVHGNCHNGRFLVEEFQATRAKNADTPEVTKMSLKRKLREIADWRACPEAGAMQGKMCWYVPPDVREKYQLQDVTLPNTWKYTLTPKRVEEPAVQPPPPPPSDVKKNTLPEQEKPPAKKRVALLMSVPRGQPFSPSTKTKLISQFMKKTNPAEKPPPIEKQNPAKEADPAPPAEIIEID
ncbi:chromatin assembly factor 1 subunit A [Lutzomyia longipalpis]|uniref:chromatin assembly factor 1 subunit A n=1 Tax=Lutzomyia longipalpis TaxID=7200 RepID=UPI0024844BEB|nr:chromatin assembly factor 1 subunit A [Lutzomyia longipalpis]